MGRACRTGRGDYGPGPFPGESCADGSGHLLSQEHWAFIIGLAIFLIGES